MLLAIWSAEPGAGRPRDALEDAAHLPGVFLHVSAPARLARSDPGKVDAWLSGVPSGQPGDDPRVHLEAHALAASAGTMPQYPLYVARAPGRLAVASDVSGLLAEGFGEGLDLRRLAAWVAWRPDPFPGETAFAGIRRLRPGELIEVDASGTVCWSRRPPRAGGSRRGGSPERLGLALRDALDDAVDRATRGASKVAVLVSGGLDSSGVLALAVARRRGGARAVEALAEVWASPGDDRPHLAALERHLGLAAVRLPARAAAPWFLASLGADAQPQPYGAACGDMHLWTTARARGADVILGGYGGDLLCGEQPSFAAMARRGHPVAAIRAAIGEPGATSLPPVERLLARLARPLIRPFVPSGWLLRRRRAAARLPWGTPRLAQLLEPALEAVPSRAPQDADAWLAHFCDHPLFAELAMAWGQIARATGVAAVDVFRDLELASLVSSIEPAARAPRGDPRGLQRLALAGLVPESLRRRRDKALGHPLAAEAALAEAGAFDRLASLGQLDELAALDLVRPAAFGSTFSRWLQGLQRGERTDPDASDADWHRVWPMLSVENFLREHRASQASREGYPHGPPRPSMLR